jgi:hypothetical protein
MPKMERVRERVNTPPDREMLAYRAREGWRLAAVEWEREIPGESTSVQDPPFGFRVSSDCSHLEADPGERAILTVALANIVQDRGFLNAAEELNRLGYRTRQGDHWTAVSVFDLLPEMIEAGPSIFATEEWRIRRRSAAGSG